MWICRVCESEVGDALAQCQVCENGKEIDAENLPFLRSAWKKEVLSRPRPGYVLTEGLTEYDYSRWTRDFGHPLKTFGQKVGAAIVASPILAMLPALYFV